MLRKLNPNHNQKSIVEQFLPESLLELKGELKRVDEILSDERFLEPFITRFNSTFGRPSIPLTVYIRMMYLKKRYNLGYETLCKEVHDSISWRIFCHIGLEEKVPHYSTLCKLTKKYGPETIKELNDLLVQKLLEEKVIRSKKIRADTTVVEADIHYPTDAELLADGVKTLTRKAKKIMEVGGNIKTRFRNRTRAVKNRLIHLGKFARKKKGEVKEVVKEIKEITCEVVTEAEKVYDRVSLELKNTRSKATKTMKRMSKELKDNISIVTQVVHQTEKVLQGERSISDRIVSIFDSGARPIKKGKKNKDVEFGRKVLLSETEELIIVDYSVHNGNPSDKTLAIPAVEGVEKVLGRRPKELAFDRGFYSQGNEVKLRQGGTPNVSIPKVGKKDRIRKDYEHQHWFKRLQRWRSGGESTIGLLKRKYGMDRSLFKGDQGNEAWVGFSIFAHNLDKAARMKV